MLNQIVLVGKIVEMPTLKETSTGIKYANLLISADRSFKNVDGVYESDVISCLLWRGVAESCVDLCEIGGVVGIKGRLQSNPYQKEEGIVFYNYEIIAEKVSFLTKK